MITILTKLSAVCKPKTSHCGDTDHAEGFRCDLTSANSAPLVNPNLPETNHNPKPRPENSKLRPRALTPYFHPSKNRDESSYFHSEEFHGNTNRTVDRLPRARPRRAAQSALHQALGRHGRRCDQNRSACRRRIAPRAAVQRRPAASGKESVLSSLQHQQARHHPRRRKTRRPGDPTGTMQKSRCDHRNLSAVARQGIGADLCRI